MATRKAPKRGTSAKGEGGSVFIAWSGKNSRSHELAKILAQRIPEILQGARPFISEQIPPGKAWMEELRQALEQCRFGILCVTPENKTSLWLQFEAGAIWKAEQQSQACALLYGLESAQLDGPLSYLQATEFDKAGVHKLLKSINGNANSMPLDDARFEKAFETGWTEIERDVSNISESKEKRNPRTLEDMVSEVLNIVRSLPVQPKPSIYLSAGPMSRVPDEPSHEHLAAMIGSYEPKPTYLVSSPPVNIAQHAKAKKKKKRKKKLMRLKISG